MAVDRHLCDEAAAGRWSGGCQTKCLRDTQSQGCRYVPVYHDFQCQPKGCNPDCSIAPANVGANTYNTALAIGEKAAMIIAEDLEIGGL